LPHGGAAMVGEGRGRGEGGGAEPYYSPASMRSVMIVARTTWRT